MMQQNLRDAAASLEPFTVDPANMATPQTAMRLLGLFNQCMIGVIRFEGLTGWERHPDDELLLVLEGEVEVTIKQDDGRVVSRLSAGEICVVPRDSWHRQHAPAGVTLAFVTSGTGNEHVADL